MICFKSTLDSRRINVPKKESSRMKMNSLQFLYAQRLGLLEDNLPEELTRMLPEEELERDPISDEVSLSYKEILILHYNLDIF